MIVKNVKGHKKHPACSCETFIRHWGNYSKRKAEICSRSGCSNRANLVGGHVIYCEGSKKQFIIPLCKVCNSSAYKKCFKLKKNICPVSVKERKNCGA